MPIAFKCSCGKAYKVPDAAAGKKMKCKECGKPVKVPAKSAKKKSKPVRDAGDEFSMDFGLEDDFTPGELPPRRKKDGGEKKNRKSSAGKKKQPSKTGLYIGGGVVAVLLIGVGGYFAFNALPEMGGPKEPIKVTYTSFEHELGMFKIKHPEGWKITSGGGSGGRPARASFNDGTGNISVVHSEKGASFSMMASAGGGGQIIPGEEIEEEPPAKSVHEVMAETKYSIEYKDFEELPGKEFRVPYGEGWLSEFTGKDGFSKIKAYRLTLPGSTHQYTIICKCPDYRFDEYKGVFMEVIKSMDRK